MLAETGYQKDGMVLVIYVVNPFFVVMRMES